MPSDGPQRRLPKIRSSIQAALQPQFKGSWCCQACSAGAQKRFYCNHTLITHGPQDDAFKPDVCKVTRPIYAGQDLMQVFLQLADVSPAHSCYEHASVRYDDAGKGQQEHAEVILLQAAYIKQAGAVEGFMISTLVKTPWGLLGQRLATAQPGGGSAPTCAPGRADKRVTFPT